MKTGKIIVSLLLMMTLVITMKCFPLSIYANDTPMDGEWETVGITSDTLDLTNGSESRPVMEFYDVVNTLLGLNYINQISMTETDGSTYFDLDKDGTDDLEMTLSPDETTTIITAKEGFSLKDGRIFTLNSIAIDYLKSIHSPGYCEELIIKIPVVGSWNPDDKDAPLYFTKPLIFEPKDMQPESGKPIFVTYALNKEPTELYIDRQNEYGNWIEAGFVEDPGQNDVAEICIEGYENSKMTLRLHAYTSTEDAFSESFTVYFGNSGKQDNPFKDVSKSDEYYNAVLWAYYASPQVTNGMDENHFGPDLTVTRAQAVTFLWRSQGCPEPSTTVNPFVDVTSTEYYYKPVLWAVENNITRGTTDTTFDPNDTLTTAHMITFLYRTKNPGKDGWDGDGAVWASDEYGRPFGVDIAVNNTTPCPRCNVVQFLYWLSK